MCFFHVHFMFVLIINFLVGMIIIPEIMTVVASGYPLFMSSLIISCYHYRVDFNVGFNNHSTKKN